MIRKLVDAGVHFGHLVSRWCPKMKPYIWGHKNKVHLIDVSKTAVYLERAAKFLESVSEDGKQILWVGTKKEAQRPVRTAADKTGMPFVSHRWIGGTLSNNSQVKKSVTKLQHHEDIIAKAVQAKEEDILPHYTKKEVNTFEKIAGRLEKNVGGIRTLKCPLGALVVVDVRREAAAIREAVKMNVPVVALVDTNGDPSNIDYVVPANDDAEKSINVILDHLVEAVAKGQAKLQAQKAAQKEQAKSAKKDEKVVEKTAAPKKEKAADDAKKEAKPKASKVARKDAPKTTSKSSTAKKETDSK